MVTESSPHVLVVGCGSVGKRHARNLKSLGCRISGVDPREDRLDEIEKQVGLAASYRDLSSALSTDRDFKAAVVATPPSHHVTHALACLSSGLPILLEKPVAPTLVEALRLRTTADRSSTPILLGYTFRWWPPVLQLRELLHRRVIGRPLRVVMTMAAHLADWHPWEPYQEFFMASSVLGGGALLDESHFLDLMLWLFEWPSEISASVERLSDLEIDADDNVEISAKLPSGARVQIHLDLFSRPHERSIRIFGTEGTLEWNNEANHVRSYRAWQKDWDATTYTCERNEMFVAEAEHFLHVVAGDARPLCTLDDGCRVLRLVEAVRESHARRCSVSVPHEVEA